MTIYTKDYVKDPVALKDYTQDWSDWLGADTIVASSWEIPAGMTKVTDNIDGTAKATVIWLTGGAIPVDYECFNTIVTAGGRTERAMIKIQVR
ncbi:hypothetical protein [Phenylobacterium sp.]|uniref:phage fiber-tail adaptor protein n=1 Tax=Phenylobacterium sp. TaxID=1871053 RepID=UPI00301DF9D4